MSNLEKIQKGMRVLQILSKIILVFACVGVVLTSIAAALVASDVLSTENQFLHFLSVMAGNNQGTACRNFTCCGCLFAVRRHLYCVCLSLLYSGTKRRNTIYKRRCRQNKAAWNYANRIGGRICGSYRRYLRKNRSFRMEQI